MHLVSLIYNKKNEKETPKLKAGINGRGHRFQVAVSSIALSKNQNGSNGENWHWLILCSLMNIKLKCSSLISSNYKHIGCYLKLSGLITGYLYLYDHVSATSKDNCIGCMRWETLPKVC